MPWAPGALWPPVVPSSLLLPRGEEGRTHRLEAVTRLVLVCVYPSQPGCEAPVAELGAPATAVVQFSHLGHQERGDLSGKNQVLAGPGLLGKRQSPPGSLWPLACPSRAWQYIVADILVWCEEGGHLTPKEGHGVGISENRGHPWAKWTVVSPHRGWSVMHLLWDSCSLAHSGGVSPRAHLEWAKALRSPSQPQNGKFPKTPRSTHSPLCKQNPAGRVRRIQTPRTLILRACALRSDRMGSILGSSNYWPCDA